MNATAVFKSDHQRYEGVRPINVYLLRLVFLLVFVFVGFDSWSRIITHDGPWNHVTAAAFSMWAAYSLMSFLGILYPLKMLPLMLFEILYKIIWLSTVAYPLWSTNQLTGSPAEQMTHAFLWVILPIIAVPWIYVLDTYVLDR